MYFDKLQLIHNRLQDSESRELFSLMLQKSMVSDPIEVISGLAKCCHNPVIEDDRFNNKMARCDGIIIYGCGVYGRTSKIGIERCGYDVECFCDTYRNGIVVDGKNVMKVDEAIRQYPNHLFCLASEKYSTKMYQNLLINNVQEDRIYLPWNGIVFGSNCRNQYIDVFAPPTGGVLIDAGAYDGETARRFVNWVGRGNYSKIICFEPEKRQADNTRARIIKEGLEKVEVINAGLWDSITEVNFNSNNAGSSITPEGTTSVKCTTIDETVKGKVSFIKMDIEGAELNALQGARNTILEDRPKMAICIYHKRSDIYDIGTFLVDIWPDCKIKIRHYTTYTSETVLYVE